jgi:hypothetical protein
VSELDVAAIRARCEAATADIEHTVEPNSHGRPDIHGMWSNSLGDDVADFGGNEADAVLFAHARADLLALLARVDELTAQLAANQAAAATRWCLIPDCFEAFDVTVGAPGWLLATALGGYVCPEHAALATTHQPQWQHYVGNRSTLRCACGWDSVPVGHRRAGTELWLDHAWEVRDAEPPASAEKPPARPPDAAPPPPHDAVDRVSRYMRRVHRPYLDEPDGVDLCCFCGVVWPCSTIQAVDAAENSPVRPPDGPAAPE